MKTNIQKITGQITITFIALFALISTFANLRAATLTVTNTADSGPGTIRAALASAANGDTINFSLTPPAKITLTSGELFLTKNLTILGPGAANLAINGNAASRVFHISPGRTVTLADLTITNGRANGTFPATLGGGLYNDHATLTVSNCTLNGNSATSASGGGGGIYNHGAGGSANLVLVNCILTRNTARVGGGIWNDGLNGNANLQIINSSVSSNSAPVGTGGIPYNAGGAIYNDGRQSGNARVQLAETTVSGNLAYSGGGIFNDGTTGSASLTITNSTFIGNSATNGSGAGLLNAGGGGRATMVLLHSTMSGNFADSVGGGIFNDARPSGTSIVQIANCTLSGNSAAVAGGGAIYNVGTGSRATLAITNSTLSGNFAPHGSGGGIYNDGTAGSASAIVASSTFSRNSAGSVGGGIFNDGRGSGDAGLQVANSTLADNAAAVGGSIYNTGSGGSASLLLGDTILKEGVSGGNLFNGSGTVTSLGYNLSSDAAAGFLNGTGDRVNTDPMLGPLQDNGGPTFTHALLCGSPAIDKGKNLSASATDQRGSGFVRTIDNVGVPNAAGGDGTDIGAFELQPAANSFQVLNTGDSGPGSLRQAILDANAHPGPDVIEFAPCLSGTILLTSGELFITGDLIINGPGAKSLSVDGNHASRVFRTDRFINVTIAGLTITNGRTSGGTYLDESGGGILNYVATLTVSNCTLSGNSAIERGGGIFSSGRDNSASLRIINSTLSGNSAVQGGGGIDNETELGNASVRIVNSTVSGNSAGYGGAILNISSSVFDQASVQIVNSTLSGNSARQQGGGIYNDGAYGRASVELGSTILNAGASGENIYNYSGAVTSLGYNLASDGGITSVAGGTGDLNAVGDQIYTAPRLGPLQDNGGPTFTHALTCRSPAIDAGKNFSGSLTDQHGFARTFDDPVAPNVSGGDGTDIGAFEAQQPLPVCDHPPVADASATAALVISPNGTNATVILDGSRSSDPDGDLLQYNWPESGNPLASGVVAVTVLQVGTHSIQLAVSDGTMSDTNAISVEVITGAEAVNRLAAALSSDVSRAQPLAATLRAAMASIDRNNPISAINQLRAFQNQVRAQIEPLDPALAAALIQAAQEIIDALSANDNPVGSKRGLVAYYPLNGDVLDASGNGHHGVNTGVSFQAAHIGQGAFFDGDSSKHVRVDNFPEIRSNLTVAAWFSPQGLYSFGEGSPLVTRGESAQEAYTLFVDYEFMVVLLNWESPDRFDAFATYPRLSDGTFYHVAFVYDFDGGKLRVYFNGQLNSECAYSRPLYAQTEPLFLGVSFPGGLEMFKGILDEVRIYDRALTGSEVAELFQGVSAHPGHGHGRFTAIARQSNGRVRIQFSAEAVGNIIIEASTNLVNWEMIGVAMPLADGTFDFEDAQSARFSNRFYRIVSP